MAQGIAWRVESPAHCHGPRHVGFLFPSRAPEEHSPFPPGRAAARGLTPADSRTFARPQAIVVISDCPSPIERPIGRSDEEASEDQVEYGLDHAQAIELPRQQQGPRRHQSPEAHEQRSRPRASAPQSDGGDGEEAREHQASGQEGGDHVRANFIGCRGAAIDFITAQVAAENHDQRPGARRSHRERPKRADQGGGRQRARSSGCRAPSVRKVHGQFPRRLTSARRTEGNIGLPNRDDLDDPAVSRGTLDGFAVLPPSTSSSPQTPRSEFEGVDFAAGRPISSSANIA